MSASFYDCPRCGAQFGIAGESSGSDDDYAADFYYDTQVEWHESGQCEPAPVAPVPTSDPRTEYIAGLRMLADLLEANPSLVLTRDKDDLLAWARAIPGRKDKHVTDSEYYGFDLLGSLRGLHLLIHGKRAEVCERVVIGTRDVTKTVPAPDAPTVEITETVEDVEWRCEPLLAEATR